jgi:nicotinamidase/pyrazinamidase
LAVANADEDAKRIAALLSAHGSDIDAVFVTLDTHQQLHVAHGMFWKDAQGQPPPPFTLISSADVESGKWVPALPEFRDWGLHYTKVCTG